MQKYILVFLICGFIYGCAFTSVGRNYTISTINEPDKKLSNEVLALHCAGTLYSFMLSPVIPLPPVIPGYGALGNGDAWITFNKVFAEENKLTSIKLIDSHGNVIFEEALDYKSDDIRYVSLPLKCKDLHNTVLHLGHSNLEKDKKYSLVYKKGDVEWNWGYLSQ